MSMTAQSTGTRSSPAWVSSPITVIPAVFVVVAVLLGLPISLPVGPMYWDSLIYYDGAHRIFDGQVPAVDFFAPVGPLGYYLFAGWLALFPNAQTTLITHWALLIITLPLMALIVAHVAKRSTATAWALFIPFLIFALLPFNGREYYPFPSTDGFGIYNRQICHMLYLLVAALLFVKDQKLMAFLVASSMAAMFLLKITGFVAAGPLCLLALLTGRITWRATLAAVAACLALAAALEITTGMISAYIRDILLLVSANSDTLLPRLFQAASLNFGVLLPGLALCGLLFYANRNEIARYWAAFYAAPGFATSAKLLDDDGLWLLTALGAGILFEAQNTGSQAFIFLWPVLWRILLKLPAQMATPKTAAAIAVLAAAAYLPLVVTIVERSARTYLGAMNAIPVPSHNLKGLADITTRDFMLKRANDMLGIYAKNQAFLQDVVAVEELPSQLLYSDIDFQVGNLIAIDQAVDSMLALEAKTGIRFETIMNFGLSNPYPYLMDRHAPRLIPIGADPFRTSMDPTSEMSSEISKVDIALFPTCPLTWANVRLFQIYGGALKDHVKITLNPCQAAYVNPALAAKIPH